jgi:hypothetical protein
VTRPNYAELLAAVDDFTIVHQGILRAMTRGLQFAGQAEVLWTDTDDATSEILLTIRFGNESDRTYRLTITEETP